VPGLNPALVATARIDRQLGSLRRCRPATRVALIGGRIGGLTAARALIRRGIEVQVYEAAPELREIGAGVALGPNAMKVLRSLDLEQSVRAIAGLLTRNGRTGRVISRASRREQAVAFGPRGGDRAAAI
jgi:2-polyprenyl-6-methoxyphenol hydroxylase-like FAD-dependent oxidoreductase